MKILIIGRNEVLHAAAEYLSRQHTIVAVITAPAAPEYSKSEKDFESLAKKLECPFLLTKKIDGQASELIRSVGADIGISTNWVSVISKETMSLLPLGILNCHPSDLPRYRGNSATNWALVMGEKRMKITVHFMQPEDLDSGNILVQKAFTIDDDTTIRDLNRIWLENAPKMFSDALALLKRKNRGRRQNRGAGFRAFPRLPEYSKIDWTGSAREIHNLIRASTKPYSGAYTYMKVGGAIKKLVIWESAIVAERTRDIGVPGHIVRNDAGTGESHILTGKGVLALRRVQFEGENEFCPGHEWKSIRMHLGIDIEQELMELQKSLKP